MARNWWCDECARCAGIRQVELAPLLHLVHTVSVESECLRRDPQGSETRNQMIVFCSNLETLGTKFLRLEDVAEIAEQIARRVGCTDWQTSSYFPYWHGGKYSCSGNIGFVWSDINDRNMVMTIAAAYHDLINETDAEITADEIAERAGENGGES